MTTGGSRLCRSVSLHSGGLGLYEPPNIFKYKYLSPYNLLYNRVQPVV